MPDVRAALLADYEAGMSQNAAARKHGVAKSTVHNWVQTAGISRTNGEAKRLSARRAYDTEFGMGPGRWVPNGRGVLIWEPNEAA